MVLFGWTFSATSGCKKKKSTVKRAKKQRCRDFADTVGGAFQHHMTAKGKGTQWMKRVGREVNALRKRLQTRCMDGGISTEKIQCVFRATPKTYRNLRKCLGEEDRPDYEFLESPE